MRNKKNIKNNCLWENNMYNAPDNTPLVGLFYDTDYTAGIEYKTDHANKFSNTLTGII